MRRFVKLIPKAALGKATKMELFELNNILLEAKRNDPHFELQQELKSQVKEAYRNMRSEAEDIDREYHEYLKEQADAYEQNIVFDNNELIG